MKKSKLVVIAVGLMSMFVLAGCQNSTPTNTTTAQNTTIAPTTTQATTTVAPTTTTVAQISKEEYVAQCKGYTYKEIARNPEEHKGKYAKLEGKVIQVIEKNGSYTLRVSITKGKYDIWEDTIMVGFEGSADKNRILEDDIVTMYGKLGGMYTYESTSGAPITVPLLHAQYIDIQ